ncbi:unnamed protein product [Owenia fusiformis]|uniref:Uncharacterized protein n=2 Tax=Owenia fusiformis TaxID=6347 RepID=A0A8S4NYI4_OWEFU|nr:unnamed protein product [Owenia fusiformis]
MEYVEAYDSIIQPIKEPLTKSYIKTSTSDPPDTKTALDYLREQRNNENEAIVFMDSDGNRKDVLSFNDWVESSEDLAVSLSKIGLSSGDFIGILAPNCHELICSLGAAINLAAVPVFLSFNLVSGEDLIEHVNECNIKAVIVDISEGPKKDIVMRVFAKVLRGEIDDDMPALRHVIVITDDATPDGAITYNSLSDKKSVEDKVQIADLTKTITIDSPLCVTLTSGSTGKPKYCLLPHRELLTPVKYIGQRIGLVKRDRLFLDRPMTWIGGILGIMLPLVLETTTVTVNAKYTAAKSWAAEKILGIIQKERLTMAGMLPYMMFDILDLDDENFSKFDLSTWKITGTGGQRVDPKMVEDFKLRTRTNISIVYGATEANTVTCMFPKGDFTKQHLTVGYPIPNIEISIQAPDGSIPAVNTPGEICIRGYPVFLGYLNNEAATSEVIDNEGWCHTGDIGTMTPYGYITIAGRLKEFIKRGTVIVQPSTIEKEIANHPDVHQVQVVGVPDPRLHEELCACIITHTGRELTGNDMKVWCASIFGDITADGLSNAPRYFIIMDEFPLTTSGKIDRVVLKAEAKKHLNL